MHLRTSGARSTCLIAVNTRESCGSSIVDISESSIASVGPGLETAAHDGRGELPRHTVRDASELADRNGFEGREPERAVLHDELKSCHGHLVESGVHE